MFVLGVDTATACAVVGATADGEVVREVWVEPRPDGRPRHSEDLLLEIERSVDAAGGWSRIDRIAVGIGPGSFTGLRIGIASARALAQAQVYPRAGRISPPVPRGIAGLSPRRRQPALPVFDARRREVFAALFEGGGTTLAAVRGRPDELAARVGELDRPSWQLEGGRYDSPQSWRPPAPR